MTENVCHLCNAIPGSKFLLIASIWNFTTFIRICEYSGCFLAFFWKKMEFWKLFDLITYFERLDVEGGGGAGGEREREGGEG